jgi:uncharacterized protein (TIGR00255 family)
MLKSMTAYTRGEKAGDHLTVAIEIRTYNSRYLDVVVRMPHMYLALEDKIKAMVSGKVARGRVELSLQLKEDASDAHTFEVNSLKAKAYLDAIDRLKKDVGLEAPVSLNTVLSVGDVIRPSEQPRNLGKTWSAIAACLQQALDDLDDMRTKEGAFIKDDFDQRLNHIADCLSQIKNQSRNLIAIYRDRLKTVSRR